MKENELYHYGVLGMRWGVRRYRNDDGTLTDAGKKRYDRDISENKSKSKKNKIDVSKPDVDRWVKEDISRSKTAVDATSKLAENLQSFEKNARARSQFKQRLINEQEKRNTDLSGMTDDDLRNKINRGNLERQYKDLYVTSPETMKKGRLAAINVVETTKDMLTIASSVLAIALATKELRG